jgi:3-oxoacyl-[acyl-carrier protein] reductase
LLTVSQPDHEKSKAGKHSQHGLYAGKIGGIASGAHYSVSEASVICLTMIFVRELAPFGVRMNALAPGPVNTAIMHSFPPEIRESFAKNCPLGKVVEVDDIAEASLFLPSDGKKHITGEILDINGGLLMD